MSLALTAVAVLILMIFKIDVHAEDFYTIMVPTGSRSLFPPGDATYTYTASPGFDAYYDDGSGDISHIISSGMKDSFVQLYVNAKVYDGVPVDSYYFQYSFYVKGSDYDKIYNAKYGEQVDVTAYSLFTVDSSSLSKAFVSSPYPRNLQHMYGQIVSVPNPNPVRYRVVPHGGDFNTYTLVFSGYDFDFAQSPGIYVISMKPADRLSQHLDGFFIYDFALSDTMIHAGDPPSPDLSLTKYYGVRFYPLSMNIMADNSIQLEFFYAGGDVSDLESCYFYFYVYGNDTKLNAVDSALSGYYEFYSRAIDYDNLAMSGQIDDFLSSSGSQSLESARSELQDSLSQLESAQSIPERLNQFSDAVSDTEDKFHELSNYITAIEFFGTCVSAVWSKLGDSSLPLYLFLGFTVISISLGVYGRLKGGE